MKYAKIINNEIVSIGSCPICTDKVSNFYLLPDSEKRQHGYFPIVETEVYENPGTEIFDTYVEERVLIDMPERKRMKINGVNGIKELASIRILSIYPEYKQINASLGIYGEEYKQEMITFIQGIRTKVQEYEALANSAITKEDLDFEVVY
jgi:hypothetical protein